jgi:hypothetical protein
MLLARLRQQCRSSAVRLLFVGTDACLTAEGLWTPATGKLICMYARQPRNDSEMTITRQAQAAAFPRGERWPKGATLKSNQPACTENLNPT